MLTTRLLELLAAAPDSDTIEIHLQPDDLPPGFVLPAWVAREGGAAGKAIAEALAERPAVVDVILRFPGHAMPIHFEMPPRN